MEETHTPWLMYIIAFSVICAMHALIYHTFFYKTNTSMHGFGVYFCIIIFMLNLLFLAHNAIHFYYPIEFLSSLALGISFLFFSGAIFYYLCLSPFYLFGTQAQIQYFAPYIRYAMLIFVILGVLIGIYNGNFAKPILKTIPLAFQNLKAPLKVLQISDLHISTLTSMKDLEKLVKHINSIQPDIIVMTGDIIDSDTKYISHKAKILSFLKSRYGTFYVLGNHEYYHDIQNILDLLKDNNITILNNTSSTVFDSEKKPLINIIGITDYAGNRSNYLKPDVPTAILKRNPDAPSILLAHQPRVIKDLQESNLNQINLILSGHTHGGQIFPFNLLVPLQQPFIKGLHKVGSNSHIYISQGSGTWGPPMRLGTKSEITLFEITPLAK